jgi:hypothetical protein
MPLQSNDGRFSEVKGVEGVMWPAFGPLPVAPADGAPRWSPAVSTAGYGVPQLPGGCRRAGVSPYHWCAEPKRHEGPHRCGCGHQRPNE